MCIRDRLWVEPGSVRVKVVDNGVGIPVDQTRRSGLANLAARADHAGGRLTVVSGPDSGTMLEWTACG